jgi:hypothetical protein
MHSNQLIIGEVGPDAFEIDAEFPAAGDRIDSKPMRVGQAEAERAPARRGGQDRFPTVSCVAFGARRSFLV